MATDLFVLRSIFDSLLPTQVFQACNWSCSHPGVSCDGANNVKEVILLTILLVCTNGTWPPSAYKAGNRFQTSMMAAKRSKLVQKSVASGHLKFLDLANGCLNGKIPCELGKLHAVGTLTLANNKLAGTIPSEFGNLMDLVTLDFSFNRIEGRIPNEFGKIQSIISLTFPYNRLSGTIPSMNKFRHMVHFDIHWNRITGATPSELGKLKTVKYLIMDNNRFQGTLPSEFGEFPMGLRALSMQWNQISGRIPSEWGNMRAAHAVGHNRKRHQSQMRADVVAFTICVSGNLLEGSVPSELGRISFMASSEMIGRANLLFGMNCLTGSIPTEFFKMGIHFDLNFPVNSLSGTIPCTLGKLHPQSRVDLDSNQFVGSIPSELARFLDWHFSYNRLQGSIPRPCRVRYLYLSANCLTSNIPSEIGRFTNFGRWNFAHNFFTGTIPSEMCHLRSHSELILGSNLLEGSIPCLMYPGMVLHRNKLTGKLPQRVVQEPAQGFSFRTLVLHGNRIGGSLAPITFERTSSWTPLMFTIHGNFLSCALPQLKIGKDSTELLDKASIMQGNRISGPLPRWVPPSERDPILYRSSYKKHSEYAALAALVIVPLGLALTMRWMLGRSVYSFVGNTFSITGTFCAPCNHYRVLVQIVMQVSVLVVLGFTPVYLWCSKVYQCYDWPPTLAEVGNEFSAQFMIGACFLVHYGLAWRSLWWQSHVADAEIAGTERSAACQLFIRLLWTKVVVMLSIPSVLYALTSSLPKENILAERWGPNIFFQVNAASAIVGALLLSVVSPKIAKCYGHNFHVDPALLIMQSRLMAYCLFPSLMVLIMHENCIGMWRKLWVVCEPHRSEHNRYNLRLPFHRELALTSDEMCQVPSLVQLATNGKCGRAVIDIITSLMSKCIACEIVMPCLHLWSWFIGFRCVAGCWKPCRSVMEKRLSPFVGDYLSDATQRGQLSAWAHLSIIWGPLSLRLQVLLLFAIPVHLVIYQVGRQRFHRAPPIHDSVCSPISVTPSIVIGLLTTVCWSCNLQMWCTLFMCVVLLLLLLTCKVIPAEHRSAAWPCDHGRSKSFSVQLEMQDFRTSPREAQLLWHPSL